MYDMSTRELYELLIKAQEEQSEKLTKEIKRNREEYSKTVKKTEKDLQTLFDKYTYLERKRRKNNLVVFGLQIKEENILKETLTSLNSLLEINIRESDVNNIYSIGKQENKKGILIEFISFLTKKSVFANAFKLKNSKIAIVNDLCPEDQKIQKILTKHLKLARSRNQKARIKGVQLEIEGKLYSAEDLENPDTEIEYSTEGEEEVNLKETDTETEINKPKSETITLGNQESKKITAKKTLRLLPESSRAITRTSKKN